MGSRAVHCTYQEMVSNGTSWLPEMWDETHCMARDDTKDMYLQFPVKYSLSSCTIHVATSFLQAVFIQKCLLVLVISLQSQFLSCCLLKPCPLALVSSHIVCCVSPFTSSCHYCQCLAVSCLFCVSISVVTVAGSVSFHSHETTGSMSS